MSAYYNEVEPYAAAWLRNLIATGLIASGYVDERDIRDVRAADLAGYRQCHFFAGIGGWSYALRLAGWPDDRPVWTGSCPCQPFSVAGRQNGFADERHLWPDWHRLIRECRPATIFGEQVANATAWLALVRGDLETLAYAVGCLPIEAASAGADHLRDRYWFVADRDQPVVRRIASTGQLPQPQFDPRHCAGALADGDGERSQIAFGESNDAGAERSPTSGSDIRLLADTPGVGWAEGWTESELRRWGPAAAVCSIDGRQVIECPDGKWRRLPPPGVRWLGARIPARISKVRAFGNAIDPRPAAQFIGAYLDVRAA